MNAIKPLKGLSKPKALKKLKGFGKTDAPPKLPDLDAGPPRVAALTDNELERLTNALEDERLAKRLLKLKEKFPLATFPELVVMDFLDRRNVKYEFQKWLLGGRKLKGGQVVDFAVDMGTSVYIWEVQGNYWHNRPGQQRLDEAQKFALLGLSVYRKPVRGVLALWESRLMDKRKRSNVLNMALAGVELGE